ncbi:MAG: radical SAM protein [Candidatus Omnitrophica bacterium]|nr:radical SAM protein [Candidatus Omnitrophota bacterium]
MKEISYEAFGMKIRRKRRLRQKPSECVFELTYRCNLHCMYCYTDCYNIPSNEAKELNTQQVKSILDKVSEMGVAHLYLTGGDPLMRPDFLEIYSYAKAKGFIITLFTNAYSMTEKIADYLSRQPPLRVEITLNAVTDMLYEKISQVRMSFGKVMAGIDLILEAGLPLKIKTHVIRNNIHEISSIKKFIEKRGFEFHPYSCVTARLNNDTSPCDLRITPDDIVQVSRGKIIADSDESVMKRISGLCYQEGSDCMHLDPYGNTFFCSAIRKPSFNILDVNIQYARSRLLNTIRKMFLTSRLKCKSCALGEFCSFCPGVAYLETGTIDTPVSYYCELAKIKKQYQEKVV